MQQNCKLVQRRFKEKFGVVPHITFENIDGDGSNFILWREPNMCLNQNVYYKLGNRVETALWFVDSWKIIPNSTLVFKSEHEQRIYALQPLQVQMNNLVKNDS